MAAFLLCHHMEGREGESLFHRVYFYKGTNPMISAPPPWLQLNPMSSQIPSSNTITYKYWGQIQSKGPNFGPNTEVQERQSKEQKLLWIYYKRFNCICISISRVEYHTRYYIERNSGCNDPLIFISLPLIYLLLHACYVEQLKSPQDGIASSQVYPR